MSYITSGDYRARLFFLFISISVYEHRNERCLVARLPGVGPAAMLVSCVHGRPYPENREIVLAVTSCLGPP